MKLLEQKTILTKYSFAIKSKYLEISVVSFFSQKKYSLPLENISSEFTEVTYYSKIRLWITILLGFFFTFALYEQIKKNFVNSDVLIFYGAIAIIGTIALFLSIRRIIIIYTIQEPLILLKNNPNNESVDEFLKELFLAREKEITKQFDLEENHNNNIDDLYKLFIMHKDGAITDKEFEQMKKEISQKPISDIGF